MLFIIVVDSLDNMPSTNWIALLWSTLIWNLLIYKNRIEILHIIILLFKYFSTLLYLLDLVNVFVNYAITLLIIQYDFINIKEG